MSITSYGRQLAQSIHRDLRDFDGVAPRHGARTAEDIEEMDRARGLTVGCVAGMDACEIAALRFWCGAALREMGADVRAALLARVAFIAVNSAAKDAGPFYSLWGSLEAAGMEAGR